MLLVLLVFAPSGYLLYRLLCRHTDWLSALTLSAVIGIAAVSWSSLIVAYLLWRQITPNLLLVVGLVQAAAAAAWLLRRRRAGKIPPAAEAPPAPDAAAPWARIVVLLLAVLVGWLYYWNFDEFLFSAGGCVVNMVHGLGNPNATGSLALESWIIPHARIGTVALITPFYVLLGAEGFGALYAVIAGLDMLLLYQLCIGRSRGSVVLAIAVTLLGVMNPLLVQIPVLEDNVVAVFIGLAFLTVLLREPRTLDSGRLAGLLFICFLAVRYVQVLAIPGLIYYFRRVKPVPGRGRAFLWIALLCALPWMFHNTLSQGWPLGIPSEDATGALLPIPSYPNFPFHDQIIRSPFNAHPTFMLHPLNFIHGSGVLLTALLLIGLYSLSARPRSVGRFLILVSAPVVLLLGLLENWTQPNKLGVVLMLYPVAILAILEGLKRLAEPSRRYWLALPVAVCGLLALVLGSAHVNFPRETRPDEDDLRWIRTEEGQFADLERIQYAEIHLLPNFGAYSRYSPFLAGWKLGRFPRGDLPGLPRCHFHATSADPPEVDRGPPYLLIRTGADPHTSRDWLTGLDEPTPPSEAARLLLPEGEPVTWLDASSPLTADNRYVILYRCQRMIFVMLLYDHLQQPKASDFKLVFEGFEYLFHNQIPPLPIDFHRVEPPAVETLLVDREDALGLVMLDVLCNTQGLSYIWDVPLHEARIELPPPRRMFMP